MEPEEKQKLIETLQHIRQEIDQTHSMAFTTFVEAVHNLSLMLTPLLKSYEALAYKLIEIETKLRGELEESDD